MSEKLETIKRKIINLLNRTTEKGATKKEAEACLKMANKLMLQYNIEENELGYEQTEKVFKLLSLKRNSLPVLNMITEISAFSGCLFMVGKNYPSRKKDHFIFGSKHDIEITLYLVEFIMNTVEEEIKQFKIVYKNNGEPRKHLRKAIKSFLFGMCDGIGYKIRLLKEERMKDIKKSTGTALIELKRENLISELKKEIPNVREDNSDNEITIIKDYFDQGFNKGKKIKFHDALCNKNNRKKKEKY